MTDTMTKSLRCRAHGRVDAVLDRVDHPVAFDGGTEVVPQVSAWVCPVCKATLAVPHAAAGRIAAALQSKQARAVRELRVPIELEDLALGINATLGTAGLGDAFTLPVHLGLQLVGGTTTAPSSWQAFDHLKKTVRARPRMHPDTLDRLQGLAGLWGTDVSGVIRWLTVLAHEGMRAGLTARPPVADEVTLEEVRLTSSTPFVVVSRLGTMATHTAPVSVSVGAEVQDAA